MARASGRSKWLESEKLGGREGAASSRTKVFVLQAIYLVACLARTLAQRRRMGLDGDQPRAESERSPTVK